MVDPILEAPCVDMSRVSPRQSENPDAHVGVLLYRIRGSLLDIGARADRIIGQGAEEVCYAPYAISLNAFLMERH